MDYKDSPLLYNNYVKVFQREIGGVKRDVVIQGAGDAVALALVDRELTKMLLVKQLRAPIKQETWEIPAGMRDILGERPEDCMVRELKEEANMGISPIKLRLEASFYPNVGISNHRVSLYYATLAKEEIESGHEIFGDDVIESKWFDLKEIEYMIRFGNIEDVKTMYAYQIVKSKKLNTSLLR